VESGVFVGRFGGEEYTLAPTEAGLERAIRRMSQLRREREEAAA
jgi:PleD family two-component response regulator